MKLAVIGSGGREDAIKWKLSQSLPEQDIFVLPGNGGIHNSVDINITNLTEIKEFCEANYIDIIIVGNEALLAAGISDFFANTHIKVLGPDKNASKLESSKIWAKNFMMKYGVATAK
ncbi:MAG: phosphoribosylamine--glycine ligase, partial [Spirochaetota bacterium]